MNKLYLKKLEEKLDLALANETTESLTNWLKEKRDTIMSTKEEQKQHLIDLMNRETLEEAAEAYAIKIGNLNGTSEFDFIRGAKWQQERMYSEEQVIELIQFLSMDKDFNGYGSVYKATASYFLEKFKKQ